MAPTILKALGINPSALDAVSWRGDERSSGGATPVARVKTEPIDSGRSFASVRWCVGRVALAVADSFAGDLMHGFNEGVDQSPRDRNQNDNPKDEDFPGLAFVSHTIPFING